MWNLMAFLLSGFLWTNHCYQNACLYRNQNININNFHKLPRLHLYSSTRKKNNHSKIPTHKFIHFQHSSFIRMLLSYCFFPIFFKEHSSYFLNKVLTGIPQHMSETHSSRISGCYLRLRGVNEDRLRFQIRC